MELMPLRLRIAAQSDAFSDIELRDPKVGKCTIERYETRRSSQLMIRVGFTADLLSLQRRTGDMRQLPDQAARLSFGIARWPLAERATEGELVDVDADGFSTRGGDGNSCRRGAVARLCCRRRIATSGSYPRAPSPRRPLVRPLRLPSCKLRLPQGIANDLWHRLRSAQFRSD